MIDNSKGQDNNEEVQPQSEVPAEQKQVDDSGLPQDASERTREQFEKLKRSNQEMKQKLDSLEENVEVESILDSLKPKKAPAMPDFDFMNDTPKKEEPLVDEKGYIDAKKLEHNLIEAKQKAIAAEKQANALREQFVRYEETQQTRAAYEKHPELNPRSKVFDKKFYNLVKNELIGQMIKGEKDVLKAAATVKNYYKPQVVEEKPNNSKEQKQQINAGRKTAPRGVSYKGADDQALVDATRRGVKGALAERLRRAGY